MKNKIIIMAFIVSPFLFSGCGYEDRIQIAFEKAYFEGQRDALSGDIRIEWDKTSNCWRWTKTPWNDGSPALLDPSVLN